jgi:hypothetical protein
MMNKRNMMGYTMGYRAIFPIFVPVPVPVPVFLALMPRIQRPVAGPEASAGTGGVLEDIGGKRGAATGVDLRECRGWRAGNR